MSGIMQHTPTEEAQRGAFMAWYLRETGQEPTLKSSRYFAFTKTAKIAFKAWCASSSGATELLGALKKIVTIENRYSGSDWEEIEEAREIASAAIVKVTGSTS